MSDDEGRKVVKYLIKKASKTAIKLGLLKHDIDDQRAGFVASQIMVAYDLIELSAEKNLKSGGVSKQKLALSLASAGLSIAQINTENNKLRCGISVGVLIVSTAKAVGTFVASLETVGGLSPVFLLEATSLLADVYASDESCGVSAYVTEEYVDPLYHWLNAGVYKALGINY